MKPDTEFPPQYAGDTSAVPQVNNVYPKATGGSKIFTNRCQRTEILGSGVPSWSSMHLFSIILSDFSENTWNLI